MSDKVRPKTYELIEKRYLVQQSYFSLLWEIQSSQELIPTHNPEISLDGKVDNLAYNISEACACVVRHLRI